MYTGGNKTEEGKLQINSLLQNLNKYKGIPANKTSVGKVSG